MTRVRYDATPKPHPRESAKKGATGRDRHWESVVTALTAALGPHLHTRTTRGREQARATIHGVVTAPGVIPIGGDIDVSDAGPLADRVLDALATSGQLTDRAMRLLGGSL